jgi:hypothetical protein
MTAKWERNESRSQLMISRKGLTLVVSEHPRCRHWGWVSWVSSAQVDRGEAPTCAEAEAAATAAARAYLEAELQALKEAT